MRTWLQAIPIFTAETPGRTVRGGKHRGSIAVRRRAPRVNTVVVRVRMLLHRGRCDRDYTMGTNTGLLVSLDAEDPLGTPCCVDVCRSDDDFKLPGAPEAVMLSAPRSSMLLSRRTPYRTIVSRATWMYRKTQLQIMRSALRRVKSPVSSI